MKIPPSLYPSPSTGEGGGGVIFILRCARPGHGGYSEVEKIAAYAKENRHD